MGAGRKTLQVVYPVIRLVSNLNLVENRSNFLRGYRVVRKSDFHSVLLPSGTETILPLGATVTAIGEVRLCEDGQLALTPYYYEDIPLSEDIAEPFCLLQDHFQVDPDPCFLTYPFFDLDSVFNGRLQSDQRRKLM